MHDSPALFMHDVQLRRGGRQILAGCDLRVATGETTSVTGRSGAGKSSLLWLALGLMEPDGGRIEVAGDDMGGARASQRARLRRQNIGVVFQQAELLPELSPAENAALPLLLMGHPRKSALVEAEARLRELGVPTDTATPALSGGEQQRVAIARALAASPTLIVADEPTGSLDRRTADEVMGYLMQAAAQHSAALLIVTHDESIAARTASSYALHDGRLAPAPKPSEESSYSSDPASSRS